MNALLIVCGLGFISLLSEILNFKKGLHAVVIAGLIAAALTVAARLEQHGSLLQQHVDF